MKTISNHQLNPNIIGGHLFQISMLILIFSLIIPASIRAEERVSYEGTLQGASCVHYKAKCPEDEAHIAIEHDFVLLLPSGEHHFLPNLNRAIKARHVGKPIRISGTIEDHYIWVDRLVVKMGTTYTNAWSWKKQQELYKGGGG
jgi:hypothetical protein